MKKLVSLISALTMCAVMAAPIASSAADQEIKNEREADVKVVYTSPEDFIITIPDSVTANSPIKVSASKAHLEKGATMTVTTTTNSGTLKYEGGEDTDTIPYTITKVGDGVIVNDAGVKSEASFTVNVDDDDAVYAGTYSDTVSFEIAVSEGIQTKTGGGEGA